MGVLVTLLVGLTAYLQQSGVSTLRSAAAPSSGGITEPGAEFELIARTIGKIALSDTEWRAIGAMGVENLSQMARSDADRLRVAIFAGEVQGPEEFRRRIDALEVKLKEDSPVRAHVRIARGIYLADGAEPPEESDIKEFAAAHGWVGRLAATHGRPSSDPERASVVGGGGAIVVFLLSVFLAGAGAVVAGLSLLIIGAILGFQGRMRTRLIACPRAGANAGILLEMVALFIAGFLVLKFAAERVEAGFGQPAAVWFSLLGQWSLLLVLLWPRVRGAAPAGAREHLGLTRGAGVLRELGAGFVGYLVCLPILVCGALASVVLMLVYQVVRQFLGQAPSEPPRNAIMDIVTEQRGSWLLVLFFLLASLWAPIAEESIFRGALFGHLRGRWHWLPAGVVTAIAFGLMHQYPLLMLGGVTSLGFGFCLLREWRGSLIASMTAHALHNAGVLTLLLVFLGLLGD